MTGVLRRRSGQRDRDTEEGHAKTETEIVVTQLQVKECQELLATSRSKKKSMEQILHQNSGKDLTLLTP